MALIRCGSKSVVGLADIVFSSGPNIAPSAGYKTTITLSDLTAGSKYMLINIGATSGQSNATFSITGGNLINSHSNPDGSAVVIFEATSTEVEITSNVSQLFYHYTYFPYTE